MVKINSNGYNYFNIGDFIRKNPFLNCKEWKWNNVLSDCIFDDVVEITSKNTVNFLNCKFKKWLIIKDIVLHTWESCKVTFNNCQFYWPIKIENCKMDRSISDNQTFSIQIVDSYFKQVFIKNTTFTDKVKLKYKAISFAKILKELKIILETFNKLNLEQFKKVRLESNVLWLQCILKRQVSIEGSIFEEWLTFLDLDNFDVEIKNSEFKERFKLSQNDKNNRTSFLKLHKFEFINNQINNFRFGYYEVGYFKIDNIKNPSDSEINMGSLKVKKFVLTNIRNIGKIRIYNLSAIDRKNSIFQIDNSSLWDAEFQNIDLKWFREVVIYDNILDWLKYTNVDWLDDIDIVNYLGVRLLNNIIFFYLVWNRFLVFNFSPDRVFFLRELLLTYNHIQKFKNKKILLDDVKDFIGDNVYFIKPLLFGYILQLEKIFFLKQRDTYRAIKNMTEINNDKIIANNYLWKELNAYLNYLMKKRDISWKTFILWSNKIINNFWNDWLINLYIFIGLAFITSVIWINVSDNIYIVIIEVSMIIILFLIFIAWIIYDVSLFIFFRYLIYILIGGLIFLLFVVIVIYMFNNNISWNLVSILILLLVLSFTLYKFSNILTKNIFNNNRSKILGILWITFFIVLFFSVYLATLNNKFFKILNQAAKFLLWPIYIMKYDNHIEDNKNINKPSENFIYNKYSPWFLLVYTVIYSILLWNLIVAIKRVVRNK